MKLPDELIPFLKEMLGELKANKLEVILIPSQTDRRKSGCRTRAVNSRNPKWYRELCAKYPRHNADPQKIKVQTQVRRKTILSVLKRLISNKPTKFGPGRKIERWDTSKYDEYLLKIAQRKHDIFMNASPDNYDPMEDM